MEKEICKMRSIWSASPPLQSFTIHYLFCFKFRGFSCFPSLPTVFCLTLLGFRNFDFVVSLVFLPCSNLNEVPNLVVRLKCENMYIATILGCTSLKCFEFQSRCIMYLELIAIVELSCSKQQKTICSAIMVCGWFNQQNFMVLYSITDAKSAVSYIFPANYHPLPLLEGRKCAISFHSNQNLSSLNQLSTSIFLKWTAFESLPDALTNLYMAILFGHEECVDLWLYKVLNFSELLFKMNKNLHLGKYPITIF